jgi:hypothetical protein
LVTSVKKLENKGFAALDGSANRTANSTPLRTNDADPNAEPGDATVSHPAKSTDPSGINLTRSAGGADGADGAKGTADAPLDETSADPVIPAATSVNAAQAEARRKSTRVDISVP